MAICQNTGHMRIRCVEGTIVTNSVGLLNGRPVGDGIAERHSELDDICTPGLHGEHYRHGGIGRGEPCGYKGHKRRHALTPELLATSITQNLESTFAFLA